MSDADHDSSPAMPDSAMTAGQLLMQARQGAGVHLAALAMTLKVPVDKLQALEADRYEAFNDVVFMRGLAASACRVLKREPGPVLALLPGGAPAPLRIDKGINASFRDTTHRGGSFSSTAEAPRSRWLGALAGVLLAGALAIALWPAGWTVQALLPQRGPDAAAAPAAVPPAPQAQSLQDTPPAPEPAPGALAAQGQAPGPAAPAPVPTPAATMPVAAAPADARAPAVPASAAVADGGAVLVIRASAPSWVQVRSGGAVVLQKMLAAGESAPVPGSAPWSVVIGKADVTQVIVRGQPMDLAAVARENVARFEVK